ncbi:hypothetical protein H8B09_04605 [Paenibacillus sp. PR3]|uniref:Uncharacterized protein n=1 Tax=Paenibacillus terricola TaxID=2763503 RepID=A0ABR8MQY9_9BACL|nr:hypothetical protein [Paenibacillus terricola]MBD3918025.1 hypothetical protein [Paenibacillus terricola]
MFKKYGMAFAVIVFVIVGVGMYAASGWKNNGRPNFKLVAVEGDASLGNNLAVQGYYNYTDSGSVSTSMKIGQQKTSYKDSRYHFQWFAGDDEVYKKFGDTKQKRRFMKGKYPFGLFVDQPTMLGYAYSNQVDGRWGLAVGALNKETNEDFYFKLELPQRDGTAYWNTIMIRGVDASSISVYMARYEDFKFGDKNQVNRISKLIRLDIDLKEQSITKETDMTADLPGNEPDTLHSTQIVSFNNEIAIIEDDVQDKSDSNSIPNYYVYSFANDSIRPIALKSNRDFRTDSMNLVGTQIERFMVKDGVVYFEAYDLSQVGDPLVNSWKVNSRAWGVLDDTDVRPYDDHTAQILYRLDKANSYIRGIAIVDVATGNLTYRGEVQTDGSEEDQQKKLRHLSLGF